MSRGLSKALFASALVVVLAFKIQAQPNVPFTFNAIPTGIPGIFAGASAWGDFDNDGKLDLAVMGSTNSIANGLITQIWKNLGNGNFTNLNVPLPGLRNGTLAWGDFDNDGYLDLFISGYNGTNGTTQIWKNLGNGTFTNVNANLPGDYDCVPTLGDYDNDGKLDILSCTGIWRNLGNFTFETIGVYRSYDQPTSATWLDYDGDGRLDVFSYDDSNWQLFHNLGNNVFTYVRSGNPAVNVGAVGTGDFDNDGLPDLVATGFTGYPAQPGSFMMRNLGDGTFTNYAVPWGLQHSRLAVADMDNDGYSDMLMTGLSTSVSTSSTFLILRNFGNWTFTGFTPAIPGVRGNLSVADFDNNGTLDVFLTGPGVSGDNVSQLYSNTSTNWNTPPSTPTGLTATILGHGFNFSWNAATDAQTSAKGLTYNLRVGTTPGGCDIVSPHSDPVTGFRRVPEPGNARQRLFTTVTNLTPQLTYYWSVQAIDNGFEGSPFAAEGALQLVIAPDAILLPESGQTINGITLNGLVNPNGLPTMAWFEYGPTTNYGTASVATDVGSGVGSIAVSNLLSALPFGTSYHYRLVASNSVGVVASPDATFYLPTLTGTEVGPGFVYASIALGDYDNDGKLDILICGNTDYPAILPVTQLWHNQGNGIFTNVNAGLTPIQGTVAWGDYDNDGFLDVLLAGRTNLYPNPTGVCELWHNQGNGTFTNVPINFPASLLGNGSLKANWGDFDNDGRLDLLISNGSDHNGQIWRNLGQGNFAKVGPNLYTLSTAAAIGDLNNDGWLDILTTGYNGDPMTRFYQNNRNGTFKYDPNFQMSGFEIGTVALGDYDNNGTLDILGIGVTNGPLTSASCELWNNPGNGSPLTKINSGLPGQAFASARWGDYDNDGRLDVLLAGGIELYHTQTVSQVWHNVGDGTFTNIHAGLAGASDGAVAWGDFDNDGKLDLLVTGRTGTNYCFTLYRSTTSTANTVPNAPQGLSSASTGATGVRLAWNAASDLETPAAGLSYNVRIGTAPGKCDILSPAANSATGQRYLAEFGNAQQRLFQVMTNLNPGLYYWSVQAVDTAFAGSPFAAESTFSIAPKIMSSGPSGNGSFQLDFRGVASGSHALEVSSDLITWSVLTNLTADATGAFHFTDPDMTNHPTRYYRVRIQ